VSWLRHKLYGAVALVIILLLIVAAYFGVFASLLTIGQTPVGRIMGYGADKTQAYPGDTVTVWVDVWNMGETGRIDAVFVQSWDGKRVTKWARIEGNNRYDLHRFTYSFTMPDNVARASVGITLDPMVEGDRGVSVDVASLAYGGEAGAEAYLTLKSVRSSDDSIEARGYVEAVGGGTGWAVEGVPVRVMFQYVDTGQVMTATGSTQVDGIGSLGPGWFYATLSPAPAGKWKVWAECDPFTFVFPVNGQTYTSLKLTSKAMFVTVGGGVGSNVGDKIANFASGSLLWIILILVTILVVVGGIWFYRRRVM